jgi:hypothetical protein
MRNIRGMAKSEKKFHKRFEQQQRRKAEQKEREENAKVDSGKVRRD